MVRHGGQVRKPLGPVPPQSPPQAEALGTQPFTQMEHSPARPHGGTPGSEVPHRTMASAEMEALDQGQGGGHTVDATVDAGA